MSINTRRSAPQVSVPRRLSVREGFRLRGSDVPGGSVNVRTVGIDCPGCECQLQQCGSRTHVECWRDVAACLGRVEGDPQLARR